MWTLLSPPYIHVHYNIKARVFHEACRQIDTRGREAIFHPGVGGPCSLTQPYLSSPVSEEPGQTVLPT